MRKLLLLVLCALGACTAAPQPVTPTRTLAPLAATTDAPTNLPPLTPATLTPVPSITPIPPTLPPTSTSLPTRPALTDIPALERRLRETPLFLNFSTERVQRIFEQGQRVGNRADVFTTIGDSNTTNGDFLQPIGMNADAYCTWGEYASLRDTVDYFSVAPSEDAANSFTHHSLTAQMGFNSASVLDPFWADDAVCTSGETPLACEYRSLRPGVAIIMIGGIDVVELTTAEYSANLRSIVANSIQQGVIPVLTTFVVLPERGDPYTRSLEFNMALLDLAADEQIPLINLWTAAQTLPDFGIGPDRTHLKAEVGSFCSFDGAQTRLGGTLRNLLTLQALDLLRLDVLAQ
jgi:hypothetical protein